MGRIVDVYGELYVVGNSTAITLNSGSGKVQFPYFNTNGLSNGVTPDHTNDHLTILTAGNYELECYIAIQNNAGASHIVELELWKNNGNTELTPCHMHRTLGAGTDLGAIAIKGTVAMAANDTIELWANTDRASDSDVTLSDAILRAVLKR